MNKLIKTTVVAAFALTATGIFAAPPHHNRNHKKAVHIHHHHRDKNDGIRTATNIVNLVGSCINLLTGAPQTVVVNQPAVVVAPPPPPPQTVIVNNPPPPPRTVVINNPPPVNNNTIIINNGQTPYRPKPLPVTHHYGRPRVKNVKHNFAAQPPRRPRR